jgi:DNA-binding transcriptional ArsR family regulator
MEETQETGNPKRVRTLRSKAQKIKDGETIADLYLKGNSIRKIAEIMGLSKSIVSSDLTKLYDKWKERTMRDIGEIKGRELAKLEKIETELWVLFEKSKDDSVRTMTKVSGKATVTKDEKGNIIGKSPSAERIETVQKNIGDAKILDSISKVVEQKCRLLGLEKIKVEVSGSIETEQLKKMSDEELDALIERIATKEAD